MRILAVAVALALLGGCTADPTASQGNDAGFDRYARVDKATGPLDLAAHRRTAASLPDRGSLMAADPAAQVVRRGASTWYPIQLSEAHALAGIARGGMMIDAPNGQHIQLKYARHVEHEDGNWSWIGRAPGARPGEEAIITFGEKAVFASIPNGDRAPLEIAVANGRQWLVETDATKANAPKYPDEPDFLVPDLDLVASVDGATATRTIGTKVTSTPKSMAATAERAGGQASTVVDVLVGYTIGFAARLGGTSQAETRLSFLMDVTNQAYVNSQVDAQINIVRMMQVDYTDTTSNRSALLQLTGVNCTDTGGAGNQQLPNTNTNCTSSTRPAALQALVDARETYGADLVTLVRKFESPEATSCGTGWLLGGGQRAITSAMAPFAFSVVADSSGTQFPDNGDSCRQETFAHQLGHNLGLQHDRTTAASSDDSNGDSNNLDPEEYGAFPYAFGYRNNDAGGNFYTIMAIPVQMATQRPYRVFSNPGVTICGNLPCGIADVADNARALRATMPIVASFRTTVVAPTPRRGVPSDVNNDGRSDILWVFESQVAYWIMNGGQQQANVYAGDATPGFSLMTTGDFNADGATDFVFSNGSNLRFLMNNGSGSGFSIFGQQAGGAWMPFSAVDMNGDRRSDLVWRFGSQVSFWAMNGSTIQSSVYAGDASPGFAAMCVADFNGDSIGDFVFSNGSELRLWINDGTGTSWSGAAYPAGGEWKPFTAGDVDGDGKGDLIWRYGSQVSYWKMDGKNVVSSVYVGDGTPGFRVVTLSDFTGDGAGDFVFSNGSTLKIWINNGTGTGFTEYVQPAGGAWQLFDPNIVE
ncbi:MAG TPA: FG-GAP-like repeat-containing protein [Lysobacter sp.]|nr:FG-GAP-like repeat-containing protein [Lysobacter sp.]